MQWPGQLNFAVLKMVLGQAISVETDPGERMQDGVGRGLDMVVSGPSHEWGRKDKVVVVTGASGRS